MTRGAVAEARIALDMLDEGIIGAAVARERTSQISMDSLVETKVVADDGGELCPIAQAFSASSGVAIGEIALDENRALARRNHGTPVVLLRRDAETSDIGAIELSEGLLTQHGARTSHAAVVARQLGKPCLVGCEAMSIDEASRSVRLGSTVLQEGDILTLDGNEGRVYTGAMHILARPLDELRERLAKLRASSA